MNVAQVFNTPAGNGAGGHAHDRTLLAKLGFADPDRRSELHDMGCQFLMQPGVASRLANVFLASIRNDELVETSDANRWFQATSKCKYLQWHRAVGEKALVKGEGAYKVTVGFIDVTLEFTVTRELWHEGKILRTRTDPVAICVEVKAGRVPVSDVIRQVNLYREHAECNAWLVASPWPVSETEKAALAREQIGHVLLGEEFNDFVEASRAAPEAVSDITF